MTMSLVGDSKIQEAIYLPAQPLLETSDRGQQRARRRADKAGGGRRRTRRTRAAAEK
jgi:hypothetical protein